MSAQNSPVPYAPSPIEPDCEVSPRYLAGPSDPSRALPYARQLADAAGWRAYVDHEGSHHFHAPDRRRGAAFLPHRPLDLPRREADLDPTLRPHLHITHR